MASAQSPAASGTLANDESVRQSLVHAARRLQGLGLNRGTSGNIGVRHGDCLLVTPSGVPPDEMLSASIVPMDFSGRPQGAGKPTSEWRIHRDIMMARTDVNAVVHTHSRYATALACLRLDIPAFHYMIAVAGGDSIRCTPYALFGSQELSDHCLRALEGRSACLLGNHGMVAVGVDLAAALAIVIEVESLCEQYWIASQLGAPHLLSESQMMAVLEKFKGYGRWSKD